jgi:hypothetical protein
VDSGAPVVPGTYTFVLHAGSKTLRAPIVVNEDPRLRYTIAQLRSGTQTLQTLLGDFGRLNGVLNTLSIVINEAPLRAADLDEHGQSALAGKVTQAAARAKALLLTITQDPLNDQDNDFLTDILRERLQTEIGYASSSFGPPTQAEREQTARLHALTNDRVSAVRAFVNGELAHVDAQLRAQKLPRLTALTKTPAMYDPGASAERRSGDDDDN